MNIITTKKLDIKTDSRGMLIEIFRPEDVGDKRFGLVLLTTAKTNETKGRHYHKRKTEWYCVIVGKGLLTLIDNKTGKKQNVIMGVDHMVTVKIPPNYYHYIKNIGSDEMFLLVYVNEPFNLSDPDTYIDLPPLLKK